MKRHILLTCLSMAALSSSCAYPIAKEYRNRVTPGLTFAEVYKDPDAYKGAFVIWGGWVFKTVNKEAGSDVYVLETPLDSGDMPTDTGYSEGRFIFVSPTYLDPLIFYKGRRVTVAGEVTGSRVEPGGKDGAAYRYPVVRARHIYILEPRQYYYPYYYPYYYGPYSPYYWEPYYGGGYWGGGFGEGFEPREFEGHERGKEGKHGESGEGMERGEGSDGGPKGAATGGRR